MARRVPLRHIFLASLATLAVVAGLLALPAMGEPHARLVAQSEGDRLAAAAAEGAAGIVPARRLSSPKDREILIATPENIDEPSQAVLGASLINDGATSSTESTTPAPSTTSAPTTLPPTTLPPTTLPPTTTTSTPPTTTQAITVPDSGGVLISRTGVVLPVIGRSSAGWRAMTPCGTEVTIDSGDRVVTTDFVLDPGHGGSETGSVGPNGAVEKALNVRIAEIVRWYLEREGYSVVLTRSTDIRMPLKSRADIANALEPKAFVSIHHNGGATAPQAAPGTEVFVDGGNPDARRLGGLLFEELTRHMSDFDADWVGTIRNGVSTRLNDDGADLYGVHRFTPAVPSVITEVGYLSNASEAELYVDNDVQWAHGRAIADALVRWDRTGDGGSGFLDDFVDASSSGTGGFDGCTDPQL